MTILDPVEMDISDDWKMVWIFLKSLIRRSQLLAKQSLLLRRILIDHPRTSSCRSLLRTNWHSRIHPPIIFIVRLNDDRILVHELSLNRDQEYGFTFLPDLFSDGFRDKEERDAVDLPGGACPMCRCFRHRQPAGSHSLRLESSAAARFARTTRHHAKGTVLLARLSEAG